MKLTNKLNLPQPIVDAVKNDPYTRGDADYSITGLIKPPRIAALEARHHEEITEDAADRIWSLVGQVVHSILERAERSALAEKRMYVDLGGKRISGAMDRIILADATLQDYKFVTLWKVKKGCPREFEEQQNSYRYILAKNGIEIKSLELVCIFRDWHRPTARREEGYPPFQVQILPVPIWSLEDTEKFLLSRIEAHEKAKHTLPLCSDEDRWASQNSWAVKKRGGKQARRVYFSPEEALEHVKIFQATKPGDEYEVEFRKGESKRCLDYCRVNQWCDQWGRIKNDKG